MIVGANAAAMRLLNRSRTELLACAADDPKWAIAGFEGEHVAPRDLPVRRALRGEEPQPMAISVAGPEGQRLFLNQSATPVRDARGLVEGAVVALTDIGDVRRARADLIKVRERKAYAIEAAQIVLWEWDPTTGCFELSTGATGPGGFVPRNEAYARLHPDDRDRVQKAFDAAFESGEQFSCEYRLAPNGAEERWMMSRGRVVIGEDSARRMSGMIADITERKRIELARSAAQEALALSEERFRLAVEGTGAGVFDMDMATGESVWTADVFKVLGYAYSPGGRATPAMFWDVVHPDDIQAVRSAQARALATLGSLSVEFRFRRADTYEERWLSSYGRVYQVAGAHRAIGILFDITERKRAAERERLLLREVDHRAKNVLAVVQSILQLTPHDDIETYIASVAARIAAIARVHTLLAEDGWVSASVKGLIEAELAAFHQQAELLEISGPDAAAPPYAAQAIAMIMHELATNAAKYGALSAPGGRLSISLDRQGDDVTIDWVERVPHPIPEQPELGFGSRMVTALAEQQLDGSVAYNWSPHGLSVRLTFPNLGSLPPPSVDSPREEPVEAHRELTGRTILLVEDDALISMALEQALKDAGGCVRAFHTVDDALSSVRRAPPDLAVLDVNIRGVPVTPVANELARHSVPFIFITGYGDDLTELPRGTIVRKPSAPGAVRAALQRLASAL